MDKPVSGVKGKKRVRAQTVHPSREKASRVDAIRKDLSARAPARRNAKGRKPGDKIVGGKARKKALEAVALFAVSGREFVLVKSIREVEPAAIPGEEKLESGRGHPVIKRYRESFREQRFRGK